eukprot:UN02668
MPRLIRSIILLLSIICLGLIQYPVVAQNNNNNNQQQQILDYSQHLNTMINTLLQAKPSDAPPTAYDLDSINYIDLRAQFHLKYGLPNSPTVEPVHASSFLRGVFGMAYLPQVEHLLALPTTTNQCNPVAPPVALSPTTSTSTTTTTTTSTQSMSSLSTFNSQQLTQQQQQQQHDEDPYQGGICVSCDKVLLYLQKNPPGESAQVDPFFDSLQKSLGHPITPHMCRKVPYFSIYSCTPPTGNGNNNGNEANNVKKRPQQNYLIPCTETTIPRALRSE